ncbi:SDR family oxidoreductase [Amycolatopsis sp. H20-H5]|uniref:SDR family oxidoreductase n=1 Tax=Amycolatopsis sp. H20-H5 TaxID=3046309 RepID=UPI002DB78898|nr:SDR family oxidoreductase [Amycolatopsis sp. H20-H5]MEC3975758.1 SDR family oxidoreductase [Amycolatopsis sp. H20-H5]
MSRSVYVAGVGMVPFRKPRETEGYQVMGATAARAALADAGVEYTLVQQAYAGYVYGDSTSGQAALYPLGLTGIPVLNVNNNCSTGSSALFLARQAVASGVVECALALGFEQMVNGALSTGFTDRTSPFAKFDDAARELQETDPGAPFAARYFGGAGREHMRRFGTWDNVVQKMTDQQWDDILDVHLKAPFRILRAAQPVISAAVKAEQANYSSAKAGVTGLTKALAKEWGRYDVTVNCVAFGLIRTRLTEAAAGGDAKIDVGGRQIEVGVNPDLLARLETGIPLGRAGTPAEGAGAVYLFCLPESDYVSGQVLTCDGGFGG